MHRRDHVFVAMFFGTILYAYIGFINYGKEFPNPFWPYLLGTLIGGMWPDFDILFGGIKNHRNPIWHSGLVHIGIGVSYMFTPDYPGFIFFLIFFCVGTSTHLFIDIIPGDCPKEYTSVGGRWGYRLDQLMKGKVHGNIKRIPEKHERKWLLWNAFFVFLMAVILYFKLQYAIDLDLPVGW
jgi:hypothetical protein